MSSADAEEVRGTCITDSAAGIIFKSLHLACQYCILIRISAMQLILAQVLAEVKEGLGIITLNRYACSDF